MKSENHISEDNYVCTMYGHHYVDRMYLDGNSLIMCLECDVCGVRQEPYFRIDQDGIFFKGETGSMKFGGIK